MSSRSPWRLSIIPEVLWGLVNMVVLFFKTLISPNMGRYDNTGNYRSDGYGPPPGAPRRRMGRLHHDGDTPGPPPMSGGG